MWGPQDSVQLVYGLWYANNSSIHGVNLNQRSHNLGGPTSHENHHFCIGKSHQNPIKSPFFMGKSHQNPIKSPFFMGKSHQNPIKSPFFMGKSHQKPIKIPFFIGEMPHFFPGRSIFLRLKAWQSADAALAAEIHRRPVGGGADVAMAEDGVGRFQHGKMVSSDGNPQRNGDFMVISGDLMVISWDLMGFTLW